MKTLANKLKILGMSKRFGGNLRFFFIIVAYSNDTLKSDKPIMSVSGIKKE